jgi:hypothetical protein
MPCVAQRGKICNSLLQFFGEPEGDNVMRAVLRSGAVVAAVVLAQTARADGLIYQLPEDGAQVRYDTETRTSVGGQEISSKGSVTVSSVDAVQVDNEKCRWIEIKMISNDDGQERLVIAKALIPEKHLGKGKSAGEHMIRGWVKDGDTEPQEVKDLKSPQALPLRAFLAGPPKDPGELDKVEVDGKLGKLMCAEVTGENEFETDHSTVAIRFENRLHEKAPFGLVNGTWKFEVKNNGQVAIAGTFKLTLVDTSTTALSDLPDRK